MSASSSSSGSSVKLPSRVNRYTPYLQRHLAATAAGESNVDPATLADDPPGDWLALASLVLGVMGLMLRYKLCAWLALFACMGSVANMRKKDFDFKQMMASCGFAVMGLMMNYFGVRQPPNGGGGGLFPGLF